MARKTQLPIHYHHEHDDAFPETGFALPMRQRVRERPPKYFANRLRQFRLRAHDREARRRQ